MKLLKYFGIFCAAACLMLCTATACGEEAESGKIAYAVTVLDPAGEPLEGIDVKFGDVKQAYHTLENGKVTANLSSSSYEIALENLPEIYKYTPVTVTPSEADKTVALEWNPEEGNVVYTVRVLLPDNTPVKGVTIGLCVENGTCTELPVPTNAKGEAYSMGLIDKELGIYLRGLAPATYEAMIMEGLPVNYTYDMDAVRHYTGGTVTAEEHVLVIPLKPMEE